MRPPRTAGTVAALRLARRDALRAKGRTALVLSMIGLPVLVIVALAVLSTTMDWSLRERLRYELGAADARLQPIDRVPISQDVLGENFGVQGPGDRSRAWTAAQIGAAVADRFGPAARAVPKSQAQDRMRTPIGYAEIDVTEVDLRDPLARGLLEITDGRAPATLGEVAVTAAVRDRGHRIGGTIRLTRNDVVKKVVGYVRSPADGPGHPLVQALPGSLLNGADAVWLVDAGRPVRWPDVQAFNRLGIAVTSAELVRDPPDGVGDRPNRAGPSTADRAVLAMAVVMTVLEVVLLAGPAFAVGLRRQRRQLALVAACGGDARQLRAIVLAGGLVLGAAAAVLGALLGFGAALAAAPVIARATDSAAGPLDVRWPLVAAPMALGALSGLLAAYMPARQAARTDVVAALAGRRSESATPRGWPIGGAALIGGGIALSLAGARAWREFGAAAGAIAIVIGCVLAGPWVVALAGRAAGPLPLPLRLAVRDASRNRGRSAPAVAAVMAAVAGVTALAIGSASDFAQSRVEYRPRLPLGSAVLRAPAEYADQAARTLGQELPGTRAVRLDRISTGGCPSCRDGTWLEPAGDLAQPRGAGGGGDILIGGPAQARYLLGRDDPAVTAALGAGRVVVFDPSILRDGVLTARIVRRGGQGPDGQGGSRILRTVTLPATGAGTGPIATPAAALFPPAVAAALGVPRVYAFHLIDAAEHRVSPAEQARVQERLAALVPDDSARFYVERGFTRSFAMPMLLLALAGGAMVLGGSLIATGLSAADARPDLATLAAIGARPRTRRLLMMGQAAFVAVLGCWLGIAAGAVPGIAVAVPLTDRSRSGPAASGAGGPGHGAIIDIPWLLLGGIAVAVPLTAALVAGVCARSRLPVTRRLAG